MDLRHAAQGVRILHASVTIAVGLADLGVLQQLPQQGSARRLPELSARFLDARVERHRRAHQGLEGHRAGKMRHLPEPMGVHHGERGDGGVRLRSIDQRDAFLWTQSHGRNTSALEQGGRVAALVTLEQRPFPDH